MLQLSSGNTISKCAEKLMFWDINNEAGSEHEMCTLLSISGKNQKNKMSEVDNDRKLNCQKMTLIFFGTYKGKNYLLRFQISVAPTVFWWICSYAHILIADALIKCWLWKQYLHIKKNYRFIRIIRIIYRCCPRSWMNHERPRGKTLVCRRIVATGENFVETSQEESWSYSPELRTCRR